MPTTRLEAFSDGVLAIIITIMVLELKVPDGETFSALWRSTGVGLLSYLLSFVYVGIYWNNHHHLLHAVGRVTGGALWANLNLLFWLSLMPLTTKWVDESHFARVPVLCYGIVLLAAGIAYEVLQSVLLRNERPDSPVRRALRPARSGVDWKGKGSVGLYALGLTSAVGAGHLLPERVGVAIALVCYVVVALLWLVPDRRLERAVTTRE